MGLIGSGLLAALALVVALWMIFRKKSKRLASWLMLLAGLFLGGFFINLIGGGIDTVRQTAGAPLGGLLGVGSGGIMLILAVLVTLELWHGMHPKKGKPSGFHPFLALAAPTLFLAAGGVFAKTTQLVTHGATAMLGG